MKKIMEKARQDAMYRSAMATAHAAWVAADNVLMSLDETCDGGIYAACKAAKERCWIAYDHLHREVEGF